MNIHTNHADPMTAALLAAGMSPTYEPGLRAQPFRRPTFYRDPMQPPRDPDPLPPTWEPGPNAKLLLDLEPRDCRFPVGDAAGVDQLFCGNEAHLYADPPYCPECARRVMKVGASVNPKTLVAA